MRNSNDLLRNGVSDRVAVTGAAVGYIDLSVSVEIDDDAPIARPRNPEDLADHKRGAVFAGTISATPIPVANADNVGAFLEADLVGP